MAFFSDSFNFAKYPEAMRSYTTRSGKEPMYESKKQVKKGFSISRAIADMDNIIESVSPTSEIEGIFAKLNESEKKAILNALKKKD